MKFFLDTADIAEIEEAASWGVLAGVTTNPTLYSRVGGKLADFHDHLKRICEIVRRARSRRDRRRSSATRSCARARSSPRSRRTSS